MESGQPKPRNSAQGSWKKWLMVLIYVGFIVDLFLTTPKTHHHWNYLWMILFLAGLAATLLPVWTVGFILGTLGAIEHRQLYDPAFELRLRKRYQTEFGQLQDLGFNYLYSDGETFSIYRLLLLQPAILVFMALCYQEVVGIQNGNKILMGSPIFTPKDSSVFAEVCALGAKFRTAFQDGTILVSKNYGEDDESQDPTVMIHSFKRASISETWNQHQKWIQLLKKEDNRVLCQSSFEAYDEICRKVKAAMLEAS